MSEEGPHPAEMTETHPCRSCGKPVVFTHDTRDCGLEDSPTAAGKTSYQCIDCWGAHEEPDNRQIFTVKFRVEVTNEAGEDFSNQVGVGWNRDVKVKASRVAPAVLAAYKQASAGPALTELVVLPKEALLNPCTSLPDYSISARPDRKPDE